MGAWGGRSYREIAAESGEFMDRADGLFSRRAPGGEWYDDIAARLGGWIAGREGETGDRLVVMHGISSRVLRGLLTGAPHRPECRAPVADGLPQGSIVYIQAGRETVLHRGGGEAAPA